jgi:hypothetical protein
MSRLPKLPDKDYIKLANCPLNRRNSFSLSLKQFLFFDIQDVQNCAARFLAQNADFVNGHKLFPFQYHRKLTGTKCRFHRLEVPSAGKLHNTHVILTLLQTFCRKV